LLGFLLVIAIFALAIVLYFKGGLCAVDPIAYAVKNNLTKDLIIIPKISP